MPSRRKKNQSVSSADFPTTDSAIDRLLRKIERLRSRIDAQAETLSPREWQVLELVAEHKTDVQIAAALGISEETVHKHTANLRAKLGLKKRSQLYTWYRKYMDK